jgi:hypothetical protein
MTKTTISREQLAQEGLRWVLYLALIFMVIQIPVSLYEPKIIKIVLSIIGVIYAIYYIRKPYDKSALFINGIILTIFVGQIGALLALLLGGISVIWMGLAVSVIDVFSFLKMGKNTLNAKTMRNIPLASKLILYAKSPQDGHLIPTKGLGDWLFYAMWIAGLSPLGFKYVLLGAAAIFIGCILNILAIKQLYKRPSYKGFPATILPWLMILIVYVSCYGEALLQ